MSSSSDDDEPILAVPQAAGFRSDEYVPLPPEQKYKAQGSCTVLPEQQSLGFRSDDVDFTMGLAALRSGQEWEHRKHPRPGREMHFEKTLFDYERMEIIRKQKEKVEAWQEIFPVINYRIFENELDALKDQIKEDSEFLKNVKQLEKLVFSIQHSYRRLLEGNHGYSGALELAQSYHLAYLEVLQIQIHKKSLKNLSELAFGPELRRSFEIFENTASWLTDEFQKFHSIILEMSRKKFDEEKEIFKNSSTEKKIAVVSHYVKLELLLEKCSKNPEKWQRDQQENFKVLPEEKQFLIDKTTTMVKNLKSIFEELQGHSRMDKSPLFIANSLKKLIFCGFSILTTNNMKGFGKKESQIEEFFGRLSPYYYWIREMIFWAFLTLGIMEKSTTSPTIQEHFYKQGYEYFCEFLCKRLPTPPDFSD